MPRESKTFISRPGDIYPVKSCCESPLFLVHLMTDADSVILSEECWFGTAPLMNYCNLFGLQPSSDIILEKCDFLFLVNYEFGRICIYFCDLHFAKLSHQKTTLLQAMLFIDSLIVCFVLFLNYTRNY